MKRGTKITVFIASMALTVGSLLAFVGPRHCGPHGMYRHHACAAQYDHHGCGQAQPGEAAKAVN